MPAKVSPFLMFQGAAAAAVPFYVSLFPDGAVEVLERYGPGEAGPEGTVKMARLTVGGQSLMCVDSPVAHAFTFTPSLALRRLRERGGARPPVRAALSDGGDVLMPPGAYGFSRMFAWLADRFGVSWQLNLA